jgi:hypothetical protein
VRKWRPFVVDIFGSKNRLLEGRKDFIVKIQIRKKEKIHVSFI